MRSKIYNIIQDLYDNILREYLPRRWIVNNGVPTKTARLFDRTRHRPDCKQGSVDALRQYVRQGDHVVVIGGGDGVTAVIATRRCEQVTVYEAAGNMVSVVKETTEINSMDNKITVVHSAVGPTNNVYGDNVGSPTSVADLPDCDILELDCKGAEEEIIRNLSFCPRIIIVEAHPQYGVSVDILHSLLSDLGYKTRDIVFQNKPHVVVGIRNS
jgi:hypothetical protein